MGLRDSRVPAAQAQLEALWSFGEDLGTAFQIIADCLDLTGEESVVGKSLGTDLGLGKLTLLMIHLIANSGARRERLVQMITDPQPGPGFGDLRQEFDVDASVAYALAQGRKFVESAVSALSVLPEGPARDAIGGLAEYVIRRHY